MAGLMRLIAFLVVIFTLIVGFGLLAGRFVETDAITTYQNTNSYRNAIYVDDPGRNLRLDVAGTRCFRRYPEWDEGDSQYQRLKSWGEPRDQLDVLPSTFDDDLAVTVKRLSCHRIESGTVLRRLSEPSQSGEG